ncbi:hypothetical protein C8Q76DRAFT_629649, partial [Earliella scabrosa]
GDAVVWWRALVLWRGNRLVYALSALLLIATISIDNYYLFNPQESLVTETPSGTFYAGDSWGFAASVFSLTNNVMATSFIAYKAWYHRRVIKASFKESSPRTRVERVLALLVESGTVYCVLWVSIITAICPFE